MEYVKEIEMEGWNDWGYEKKKSLQNTKWRPLVIQLVKLLHTFSLEMEDLEMTDLLLKQEDFLRMRNHIECL